MVCHLLMLVSNLSGVRGHNIQGHIKSYKINTGITIQLPDWMYPYDVWCHQVLQ